MKIISYSSLKINLANILDEVNDNYSPVIVTKQNGKAVVIISVEDYKSYEETAYLMASLKNAKRLNDVITEIEANIA